MKMHLAVKDKHTQFRQTGADPIFGCLVGGGGGVVQPPRPKVADVAEQSDGRKVSCLQPGSRAHLKARSHGAFFYVHLRLRKWIVWISMTLFIWCDFTCVRCTGVCNVAHDWVPYPFCAIATAIL